MIPENPFPRVSRADGGLKWRTTGASLVRSIPDLGHSRGAVLLVSRGADAEHVEAIPRSLVAARRSVAGLRRLLLVSSIAFIATPIALLAMLADTPLQFLPLAIALAGAIWMRLEMRTLERDLRRARVRALDAVDVERQRIQRDLHDSAQQRLVSVRIHLGLLAQATGTATEREAIEQLGRELDIALSEIRTITRDGSPQLLRRNGVVESLRSVADHTPRPVTVESVTFGRYAPQIERGIYYCCLEALQNVIKHAGPNAAVWIRLVGEPNRVSFSVDDSGIGFDPANVQTGVGLVNLADRVDVMGGRLTVDSMPGMGTRIHGEIPLDPGLLNLPFPTSLSPSPARSGVRARLGAGVDVGAHAEVYRNRGEPDRGAPGDQGAEDRPLAPAGVDRPWRAGRGRVRRTAANRRETRHPMST